MKGAQLVPAGHARLQQGDVRVQTLRGQFQQKMRLTIGAKRVSVAETVAGAAFSGDDGD
jgi:hypothetical protein